MPVFSPLHYVNVGPEGTFRKSKNLKTNPQDIDALFAHLDNINTGKIAIHFHGGLIKEQAGLEIAEKMWDLFKDDAHPVTFVWETGFFETLVNNFKTLNQTKLFKKIVQYVIRQVGKRLGGGIGGKGVGEAMTLEEIEAEIASGKAFDEFDEGAKGGAARLNEADVDALQPEIEAELEEDFEADPELEDLLSDEAPETDLLNDEVVEEIRHEEQAKGIISTLTLAKQVARIVLAVIRRYLKDRDHGFYPTVIEEVLRAMYLADFGAWVWGAMKTQAEAMWEPNDLHLTDDSHVGTYFLEKLAVYQSAHPDMIIDLVGHSAGSIAICHMLKRAAERHPDLKIRNILLLAPACRSDLFHQEIVTQPDRYERFRMFTMHDDLEAADRLFYPVYTRSLLYFISGVLEAEADASIAGLEYQARGTSPYDDPVGAALHQFLHVENRLALSESIGLDPGLNTASRSHGDFDDDPVTRGSLRSLISS